VGKNDLLFAPANIKKCQGVTALPLDYDHPMTDENTRKALL